MSTWPHIDLPKPRPVSLSSIVASRARKATARPLIPQGATQQGRHEPTYPTEAAAAATEVGAEPVRRQRAPDYPWVEFGCALLMLFFVVACLHVVLTFLKGLQ